MRGRLKFGETATGSLKVGDEIADELLTGEKITCVVANISPEEVCFISKDCLNQRVQWNASGMNAGVFKESDFCRYRMGRGGELPFS